MTLSRFTIHNNDATFMYVTLLIECVK